MRRALNLIIVGFMVVQCLTGSAEVQTDSDLSKREMMVTQNPTIKFILSPPPIEDLIFEESSPLGGFWFRMRWQTNGFLVIRAPSLRSLLDTDNISHKLYCGWTSKEYWYFADGVVHTVTPKDALAWTNQFGLVMNGVILRAPRRLLALGMPDTDFGVVRYLQGSLRSTTLLFGHFETIGLPSITESGYLQKMDMSSSWSATNMDLTVGYGYERKKNVPQFLPTEIVVDRKFGPMKTHSVKFRIVRLRIGTTLKPSQSFDYREVLPKQYHDYTEAFADGAFVAIKSIEQERHSMALVANYRSIRLIYFMCLLALSCFLGISIYTTNIKQQTKGVS